MSNIKLDKLPSLLNDMRKKQRKIELFPFQYNDIECTVFLTLLEDDDKKRTKYTVVDLEFLKVDEVKDVVLDTIFATADFYEVLFYNKKDFYKFFDINVNNLSGSDKVVFRSFSDHFAKFIPEESTLKKSQPSVTKKIMATLDNDNPNAIYCYDVRRSGSRADGRPKKRSLKNSNKAQRLRPDLFNTYQEDKTYSFYFSDNSKDEKSDIEIMHLIAQRQL